VGDLRIALFKGIGRALWRPALPRPIRAAVIAALFRRRPGRGRLSRQLALLAEAVMTAGAARLRDDPRGMAAELAALKRQGATPVLIAGDSHSRLWVHRDLRGERWLLPLLLLATGASARGLANAGSRSGQRTAIQALDHANACGPGLPMLLVFGQVDIEFVQIFKRLSSEPAAPLDADATQAFAVEVIDAYLVFVGELTSRPALAAILPPALSDAAWREGYLNAHIASDHADVGLDVLRERLRRTEIADLADRTAQHREFNALLGAAASAHGLRMVDPWPRLPMAAGVVSPVLLGRAGGRDHHLDAWALRPYLTAELWDLLDGQPPHHGFAPPTA
jgi:hypothetical protein